MAKAQVLTDDEDVKDPAEELVVVEKKPEPPKPDDDDDEDDDAGPKGPMSQHDKAWFRAQGIDPDKKYLHKNSTLTIVAYKPSRWKYPGSVVNQNGRGLKCGIGLLKQCRVV